MFFLLRFFSVFFRFFEILARFWEARGRQKIEKKSCSERVWDFGPIFGAILERFGGIWDGFWIAF